MKPFLFTSSIGSRILPRFAVHCTAFTLLMLTGACEESDSASDDCDEGFTEVDGDCVPSDGGDSGDSTRGRLVTASATLAEVYVVDLDTFSMWTVDVSHPNAIIQGTGGESPYSWMIHYPTGPVEIVDVGSRITGHGDHSHVKKKDPTLHPFAMEGPEPTHIVAHDDLVAVYFDGLGEARLVSESQLATGEDVDVDIVTTNQPHHGVALVWHDHVLITVAETIEEESVPMGVAVYDLADTSTPVYESEACTGLHGETSQDGYVTFGCDEGVLLFSHDGTDFSTEMLPYPNGSSGRSYFAKSHPDSPVAVGDFGPALAAIDPVAGTVTSHSLPAAQVAYAFEDGEHLLVLAADGSLYRVSLDDFSVEGDPLPLVTELGDEDSANVFVAADRLYALDSREASVVAVDLEAWDTLDTSIELPSAPNTFLFRAVSAVLDP